MTGITLPEEAQQLLAQYQSYQQQLQLAMYQKDTLSLQLIEIKNALEELEKSEGDVYKIVGPVLVKTDREKTISELKEKIEELEVKIKSYEKQIEKLKEKMKEKEEKLKSFFSEQSAG